MSDVQKPAKHGRDHRDEHIDAISGPWFVVLDAGDPAPEGVDVADVIYLENGVIQPPITFEPFTFRRGLSRLDFKGHLDVSAAVSPVIAFTIPIWYRLDKIQFGPTVITDDTGTSFQFAMFWCNPDTGKVTIVWPAT